METFMEFTKEVTALSGNSKMLEEEGPSGLKYQLGMILGIKIFSSTLIKAEFCAQ